MKAKPNQSRRSKIVLSSAALAALGIASQRTFAQSQQVFTQWNFDQIQAEQNYDPNSPPPTIGTGTATALGMTNSYTLADGSQFSVNSDDVTGGNPLDPTQASGPGTTYTWRVRGNGGGGGNGWSTAAPQYTQGAEFDTSTAGKSGIVFSCDLFCTNQGVHTLQEQYTTDGTDWINFGSVQATVPNGFVYDLSMDFRGTNFAAVNNDASFGVRLVSCYDTIDPGSPVYGSGYSSSNGGSVVYNNSSGNWRFANVTFSFTGSSTGSGSTTPVLTYNPPSTSWNNVVSNANWKDTNGASVSWGGTSTIAAFTDAPLPFATSTATVTVDAGGVDSGGVQVSNTNGTYIFTGGSINSGTFTKSGGGNVILQGSNSFGGLVIGGGTLHTANDANLGAATAVVNLNGGTLVADAALNIAHKILVGTNGGAINSNFSVTTSGSFNLQGAFVKNGSGDLTIGVATTVSPGATFLDNGGNLILTATNAVSIIATPASGTTFAGNIIVANSKGLSIVGGNVAGTGTIQLQVNNTEFKGDSITGTTFTTVFMPIQANSLNQATNFTVAIGASGVGDIMVLEPTAIISGTSNVIFAGGNSGGKATLIIDSQNTYNGNTIINNDNVGLTKLGVSNAFPVASNFAFGDGKNTAPIGALDLNGFSQQLGSIATNLPSATNQIAQYANGICNSGSTQSTLTISGTATTLFNAVIGTPTQVILDGGAAINNIALTLDASNTGFLELAGQNSYIGTTTINGGTLQFDVAQNTIGVNISSMPTNNNVVNNASLIINSPNSLANNISGSGTTTVNGTSLSFIQTLISPGLTVNSITQGALVNNGTATVNVTGSIGAVSGSGSFVIGGNGSTARVSVGSFSQGTVTISDQATLAVLSSGTPSANSATTLSISGSGQLDLANGSLLTSTPSSTVRQYLINGYNNGAWNGTGGITSMNAAADHTSNGANAVRAVGYSSGTTIAALGLSSGQTLVKYTIYGDADLSGGIDIGDLNIVLNNFLGGGTWDTGDFFYSGATDISDLNVVLNNFFASAPVQTRPLSLAKAHTAVSTAHTLTGTASPDANPPTPAFNTLELVVNVASGDVEIVGNNTQTGDTQITSSSNGIITAQWHDLKSQGFSNWQDTAKKAFGIGEFDTQFAATGDYALINTVDYGNIYNTTANAEDYVFKYGAVDQTTGLLDTLTGSVFYVGGVPEPTTLSLIGIGAAGLLARRRKSRQRDA